MITIRVIDLDTCGVLATHSVELNSEADELVEALERNPYLIEWPHEQPWRYRVEVEPEEDEGPEFPMGEFPRETWYEEREDDFWVRGLDTQAYPDYPEVDTEVECICGANYIWEQHTLEDCPTCGRADTPF